MMIIVMMLLLLIERDPLWMTLKENDRLASKSRHRDVIEYTQSPRRTTYTINTLCTPMNLIIQTAELNEDETKKIQKRTNISYIFIRVRLVK